ncbi:MULTISPECIES: hypothetical protein [unclassified Brevundimonas]|uniref:hypothetical protein n=1 Tax=unclassified Brevundimonas TaxID=2622653 RepID=UPI000CFBF2B2|nr:MULTISPECIES: hypothetical protein [unclassified Brevundimonas]PRA33302.1 hypothetical protein CQ024_04855 [Brevundimonas sp. MYb27]PQZ83859.1 hypothetical protein CQ026_03450 [Brevundimonas sp. MYb31]PRB13788.1 hypothetical protein CQ039_11640 [Brevundimonas sp. MYb52]PRB34479.1 hypothetical protein CQ035_10685 [Brevundimonas sp. MYb46]PRB53957.1 hypothetical protein CQ028_05330 [Brevundimonas sp. MYb33]
MAPAFVVSSASAQAFLAQTSLAQLYVEQTSPAAALTPTGPQALSDEELSGLRGGFLTTNGFTFGFGVVIRSYVDDRLALETRMTWTPTGPATEQTRGDVPGMTDLASALTSLLNSGIDLRNLGGTSGGVALVSGDGATALIHNVTSGQLQNLIVNNASNRDLRQDMELNLYLPDLATMQASSSAHARAAQLTYDLNTSLVGSLGR